ncbi:hypothetical protein KVT40_004122 [Elsinoe batatas]|uniref:Uncharacterized protein n=1 Tax=Elsinoe batatas TaxID=2601811 RepID=A0A8K0L225_9PEZI|nr:hypothetical protein KVT40_004122 [Elsinoe batatas]
MQVKSEKPPPRFRCDVCQQGFTRTDHLKRHQLRHSGLKPYVCGFCNDAFARCDSLRNHYSDCPERGNRPIPETDQKGRRRHACELCISMKLRCDGNNPCSSCQKRGTPCLRPDKTQSPASTPVPIAPMHPSSSYVQPKSEGTPTPTSDRHADMGSIKFLLNGGQDGFMEDWHFPGRLQSAKNSPAIKAQPFKQMPPAQPMAFQQDFMSMYPPEFFDPTMGNMPDLASYRTSFNSFFDGPFDAFHQQWQDSISGIANHESIWGFNSTSSPDSCDYAAYAEPQTPNVAALIEALQIALAKLNLDLHRQQELNADLHFLLTPGRVRRFVSMYRKIWHPNCPIIHIATFDIETTPLPLLASVVFMGAMYSVDTRELSAAKSLLDLIEMFVFSTDVFSPDMEVKRAMMSHTAASIESMDWLQFQHFQAAYLNVVVQHWAGNRLARDRSMEARFSEVIRVARSTSLHKIRHQPEDRIHQHLWIQKECRVRTMNIIHSLDGAFLFFHNYPCRLSFAEMECDLPCDELLFSRPNPFAEPAFRFNRGLTLRQGFEALFQDDTSSQGVISGEGLTVLDMFLLIHVLYAFVSAHLVLRTPFGASVPPFKPHPLPSSTHFSFPTGAGPTSHPAPTPSAPTPDSSDPAIARALQALQRWRELWTLTCNSTSSDAWTKAGFFKSSYKFWLVAQLVATKHQEVEGGWLLEPKCEEKLVRLQTLAG